jgi:DNA repair protein
MEKDKKKCVECGKDTSVMFEILDIPLCRKCQKNNEKYKMITKTRAMAEYRLKKDELFKLKHIEVKNPHYASAAPMILFLKSQVEEIALEKWGDWETIKQEIAKRQSIGEKIRKSKEEAKKKREEMLIKALNKKGLDLRNDSMLCRNYINGRTLCTLDEVVQIMERAYERHTKTPYDSLWKKYHKEIEEDAEIAFGYFENWTDAWDQTIGMWRRRILKEAYATAGIEIDIDDGDE